jgi:hypothetical protein
MTGGKALEGEWEEKGIFLTIGCPQLDALNSLSVV